MRALNGHRAKILTATDEHGSACVSLAIGQVRHGGFVLWGTRGVPYLEMILQPTKILIRPSRVYDKQVLLLVNPIYNQIIYDPAALIQQKRVLTHADAELFDVVSQHAIEPIPSTAALDDELAHVRNVEHAGIVPHCLMFLDNAGVLHRH